MSLYGSTHLGYLLSPQTSRQMNSQLSKLKHGEYLRPFLVCVRGYRGRERERERERDDREYQTEEGDDISFCGFQSLSSFITFHILPVSPI